MHGGLRAGRDGGEDSSSGAVPGLWGHAWGSMKGKQIEEEDRDGGAAGILLVCMDGRAEAGPAIIKRDIESQTDKFIEVLYSSSWTEVMRLEEFRKRSHTWLDSSR